MQNQTTDFGFERVAPGDKARRVAEVFSSVASRYDLMNDLMSCGMHHLWKRFAVHVSGVRKGQSVLDVAGGTGDMTALFHKRVGAAGLVVLSDINRDMLDAGRNKLCDQGVVGGVDYTQANAEKLPFRENSFDCVSIAFGLRNVTDKAAALRSMHTALKYGGTLIILEFSHVVLPLLQRLYDTWSFRVIPWLGRMVAQDEASYRYLVESIRMHPDQEILKHMLEEAGFARVEYYNLSGGIVAVHKACKV
jgi:demethylmenaquinone methyltransferase/2-methoxy-6-polyprenyl-1,4-benzoquinol methylase